MTIWDWFTDLIGVNNSGSGNTGDVESWRGMAMDAMRRNGFDADDPAQVNAMLEQMWDESKGDPSAVQGIIDVNSGGNEAVGLLQVTPGTFADHRDPELPNDRTDAWANMNAALRYYKWRYGDDLTTNWGAGKGGYALGGIVGMPELLTRDLGGLVPHGALVRNTSGRDEMMLPPSVTSALVRMFPQLPVMSRQWQDTTDNLVAAAGELRIAAEGGDAGYAATADLIGGGNALLLTSVLAGDMENALLGAQQAAVDLGNSLSNEFIDSTDEVQAAFRNLEQARQKAADNSDKVTEAEKELAAAQKELQDTLDGSSEQSTSIARKIEDAEAAVTEARNLTVDSSKSAEQQDKQRAANAEKLADAQKKLARAEEDAAAETVKSEESKAEAIAKAREKVEKAEQGVADAHDEVTDSAEEVIAAEREVAAARIRATAQVGSAVGNGLVAVLEGAASFTAMMKGFADEMKGTEERLRSLRVESATAEINRLRALANVSQAEKDLEEARISGAETTRMIGDTSVKALGGALREFQETGVLAVETITVTTSQSAQELAQQQAEIAEQQRKATLQLEIAALDYMEATINSARVTEMQKILTAQLAAQQTALYGLSSMQYDAMTMFMQGVAKVIGGIVKIGMAIAAAAVAIASGGIMAIPAAIGGIAAAVSGVGDLIQGGMMMKDNWDGFRQGWGDMDTDGKLMLVGTTLASTGSEVANVVNSAYPSLGIPGGNAQAPWDTLNAITEQQWNQTNQVFEDQLKELDEKTQKQLDEIGIIREALQLMIDTQDESIRDMIDIDGLLETIRGESTQTQATDLVTQGVEASQSRRDLLVATRSVDSKMDQKQTISVTLYGSAQTNDDVIEMLEGVNSRIDGVEFQVQQAGRATARDIAMAAR